MIRRTTIAPPGGPNGSSKATQNTAWRATATIAIVTPDTGRSPYPEKDGGDDADQAGGDEREDRRDHVDLEAPALEPGRVVGRKSGVCTPDVAGARSVSASNTPAMPNQRERRASWAAAIRNAIVMPNCGPSCTSAQPGSAAVRLRPSERSTSPDRPEGGCQMAVKEIQVEWKNLDSSHIGRTVHIDGGAAHHWGVITRMFRNASHTTIFLGSGEQKDFSSIIDVKLYFIA